MAEPLDSSDSAAFERRKDAGPGEQGEIKLWLDAIALAEKTEKEWRNNANDARDRYRDEKQRKDRRFNILYANTETYVPAVYGNTPVPDIRRRFRDNDPVGKVVAQIIERSLSFTIDAYDFDDCISSAVRDNALVGRGLVRVRYEPLVKDGVIEWQMTYPQHVQWDMWLHGPGRKFKDWPWLAFKHLMTREELDKFGAKAAKVNLDWSMSGDEGKRGKANDPPDVFKRATVWEIWDRDRGEVKFLAVSKKDGFLKRVDDPLHLQGFFPTPRPLYFVRDPASSVPQVPYQMYRDQAEELDRITARITALVKVLKWRGVRDQSLDVFEKLKDAEDGDLVPSDTIRSLLAEGGIEKAVWLMPIENVMAVLTGLYEQREQIKATIYEITGVADIMRGASDPNETLGAQEIKQQWGSLRVRDHQREVQRLCRDLFRMMGEITAEHFEPQTLQLMTGIELPDAEMKAKLAQAMQAKQMGKPIQLPPALEKMANYPTWDEVLQVMRSDGLRGFRVDMETDSTIQTEMAVVQQNAGQFVQGFSGLVTAFGPAVEAGIVPMDVVKDILASFTRMFKLGRQAEDAIERLVGEQDTLGLGERPPQQEKRNPGAAEAQAKVQIEQMKLQFEDKWKERETGLEEAKAMVDAKLREMELQLKAQAEQREEQRLQIEGRKAEAEIIGKAAEIGMGAETKEREMGLKEREVDERGKIERDRLGEEKARRRVEMGESPADSEDRVMASLTPMLEQGQQGQQAMQQALAQIGQALAQIAQAQQQQLAMSQAAQQMAAQIMNGARLN